MPAPTIFSYSIADESGDLSSSKLYVSYDALTETVESLRGAAAAFGGAIDAVTGGKIVGFTITIPFLPDPGWKAAALVDSDIQKTLLENFNAAGTPYPEEFTVPVLRGTLVNPDGTPIIGGGAIKTLNDLIVAGSGAIYPNSKHLEDLTALRDAAVTFRRDRGQVKKSKVTPAP